MKIISRVFILFLSVFTLCVIVGCTTPSDSSDNNYSDPGSETQKAFYYDSDQNAFVGTFTWEPESLGYKALIGAELINNVYWRLEFPEWAGTNDPNNTIANSFMSGLGFGDTHYAVADFVPDMVNYTVSGTVKIAPGDETWKAVLEWADVPGVKVRAIMSFKDAASSAEVKAITGDIDLSPIIFEQETYYSMDLACPNSVNVSEFIKQDENGWYIVPYAGKYVDPGLAASTKKAWYKKIKSVTINQYRKSDAVGPDEKPVKSYTASSDYWLTGVDSKSYFSPAIVYDDEHYDYTYSVTTWNIAGGWGSFWCIQ